MLMLRLLYKRKPGGQCVRGYDNERRICPFHVTVKHSLQVFTLFGNAVFHTDFCSIFGREEHVLSVVHMVSWLRRHLRT